MEEALKDNAAWLVAESAYRNEVSAWLNVETAHKAIEAEKTAKIVEAKLAEVPEKWRDHLKDASVDKIESFMEVLKNEPAGAPVPPASGPAPEPKPGEKGYKRHFFS